MRRISVTYLCGIVLMAFAVWTSGAGAFDTYTASKGAYNTNCAQCHGDFTASSYKSLIDGQSWGGSLHDVHRYNMLNGDCNACHLGFSKTPVSLNSSNGGNGLTPIACMGCHGRAEDNTTMSTSGAGLRQHHYIAGETSCLKCHNDAKPANYTPVSEKVPPPYYFTPDTAHPNKPTDSCNASGKENFAGSTLGLDNDGDGLFDGNDPDCQTAISCIDNDGDGYGSNGASTCPKGTAIDCNDNNAAVNPGAVEVCDGIDNNCNGQIDEGVKNTYYKDADGDGYGTPALSTQGCTQPAGYAASSSDCNDNDPNEHPNQTWYQDADGDGYSSGNIIVQCARPTGYKTASELTATSGDCNDTNAAINPGAVEICDGIDNNCNGQADENIASTPTTCGVGACASTGAQQCTNGKMVDTCAPKASQTEGPFGSPTCSDKIDNDCDGSTDASDPNCVSGCVDKDGDGYGANGDPSCRKGTAIDCNDNNAAVNPGAAEICDGIDNNCNGQIDEGVKNTYYKDSDGDGYGDSSISLQACAKPAGYVTNSTDCNDSSSASHPGAAEICDGIDNNCDGQVDEGIASTPTTCGVGACASTGVQQCTNGKMVDTCTAGNPQTEGPVGDPTCSDGLDNDCNGLTDASDSKCVAGCVENTYYKDRDGDGYGDPSISIQSCIQPAGYVTDNTDCKDSNRRIHPGAVEICDGKDNNCDGQVDEGVQKTFYKDTDGDGYGDASTSMQACRRPAGYVRNNTDCNDSKRKIHPGAIEICDGKDNNCDGQIDEGVQKTFYKDSDGDGYGTASISIQACTRPDGYVRNNTDCNDLNQKVHVGTAAVCGNQNGDGDSDGEGDNDFSHNYGTDCLSCHTPHNAITDCISCHSGLTKD